MLRLLLIVLFMPLASASAQKKDTVKSVIEGIVRVAEDTTGLFYSPPKDVENDPWALPNVNVTILNPADSSVVAGAATNDKGHFTITGIPEGSYILRAMYVGYETTSTPITINAGDTLRKDIVLGKVYSPEELPFGAEEARKDFMVNNVALLEMDWITLWHVPKKIIKKIKKCRKKFRRTYGFTLRNIQDEFITKGWEWHKIRQAVIRYNETMKKLLKKRNGSNWYERYEKQIERCPWITQQGEH